MNRVSFASLKSTQHLNFAQKTPTSSKSSRNKSFTSRGFNVLSNFPTIRINTTLRPTIKPNSLGFKGLLANIDEDANFTGLEDGKMTKLLYNKFTFVENAIAFLSFLGMVLAVINYDYNFGKSDDNTNISLLILLTATTIILYICLIFRHLLKLKLSIARGKKAQNETLFTSGQIYFLLIDAIIIFPHPSVLFIGWNYSSFSPKDGIDIEYSMNEIFSIFIQLRIIMIFRAFLNFTIYTQPRAYRICCIYDAEFGYLYAIKALIKRYPIIFLLVIILVSTLLFSHAIRVCEKPFDLNHEDMKMDIGYYSNALWVVVVTMYTIGYGDYYPRSNLGRCMLFFVEIYGNFLISMMVVAIGNLLLLDNAETKALCLILRLEKRKSVQNAAVSVISSTYRLRLGVKYKKITKFYKKEHLIKIKKHLEILKKLNRKLKQKSDGVTMFEFLAKNFENFMNDLKTFAENQDKIMKKHQTNNNDTPLLKTRNVISSINSLNTNNFDHDIKKIQTKEFKVTKVADE